MASNKLQEHGSQDLTNMWRNKYIKEGALTVISINFENKNMIIVVVYIDDIIFGIDLQILSVKFASKMKEFEMSMLGELTFFLGLKVSQSEKGIFISQTKYIKDMLKKFKMEESKPISIPMVTGCKLSKDDESLEVDHTMYRSMIGIFLYVTTKRGDVMHSIRFLTILQ